MPDARRAFGTQMESQAAQFLQIKGYRVLAQQYVNRFGEIDLICQDGDEIVFVEVKARHSGAYGYPEACVSPQKLKHIVRCGQHYLKKWIVEPFWRIDVVAIETKPSFLMTHIKAVDITDRF